MDEHTEIIRTHPLFSCPLEPPHDLTLGPSRLMTGLLLAGHIGVLLVVAAAEPPWSSAVLLPWWIWSLHRGLCVHARRTAADAVVRVHVDRRSALWVRLRDGTLRQVSVGNSSTLHPWVSVLNLTVVPASAQGRRLSFSVIIPRDAGDSQGIRRLRVWLRWGEMPGAGGDVTRR